MRDSFCKLLPKIELHAHLNGSINLDTLRELYSFNRENGNLKIDEEKWKEWEIFFHKPDIMKFTDCFQIFSIAHAVTITPESVKKAMEKVIEDFAVDNTIYLELRSTPRAEKGMSKNQYLEAMLDAVKRCRIKFPTIVVKLIISINRKSSIEEARENVKLAIDYSKIEPDIVVGIDLSGDPTEKKFPDYAQMLNEARQEGLKLALHFAEIPGNEEIHDILSFAPDRLGHGTCVHPACDGCPDNWELLLKSGIPVEACITSNLKCKTVTDVDRHHFKYLYQASHPVVLCTDDKSVFQTDLSSELEIARSAFNLSKEELWQLSYKAVEYAFADNFVKSTLKSTLLTWKESNILEPTQSKPGIVIDARTETEEGISS